MVIVVVGSADRPWRGHGGGGGGAPSSPVTLAAPAGSSPLSTGLFGGAASPPARRVALAAPASRPTPPRRAGGGHMLAPCALVASPPGPGDGPDSSHALSISRICSAILPATSRWNGWPSSPCQDGPAPPPTPWPEARTP